MTLAVVPACGRSTRMGRPKLILPLGKQTVIEKVVESLRKGGVNRILVVVGPDLHEVAALASSAGAEVLQLKENTPDMRATVECGIDWIEKRYRPAPSDLWLLAPADHPAFDARIVRELLSASRANPEAIIIPTHDEKRGHPVSLPWRHIAGIRSLPEGQGINSYLLTKQSEVLELAVADPGILVNLDTPEDYDKLKEGL